MPTLFLLDSEKSMDSEYYMFVLIQHFNCPHACMLKDKNLWSKFIFQYKHDNVHCWTWFYVFHSIQFICYQMLYKWNYFLFAVDEIDRLRVGSSLSDDPDISLSLSSDAPPLPDTAPPGQRRSPRRTNSTSSDISDLALVPPLPSHPPPGKHSRGGVLEEDEEEDLLMPVSSEQFHAAPPHLAHFRYPNLQSLCPITCNITRNWIKPIGKIYSWAIPYWNVPYDIHNFETFSSLVTIHKKSNEVMFCCYTEYYGKVI